MTAFQIRDLTALLATLVIAVLAEVIFIVPVAVLANSNLHLYGIIFGSAFIRTAYVYLSLAGAAFIAVAVGTAISPSGNKKRNSWLFTLGGVVVYAIIFCKILFIPHRETDHSAMYVLFTTPQIYLYGVGGILVSLRTSYRKDPNSGDRAQATTA